MVRSSLREATSIHRHRSRATERDEDLLPVRRQAPPSAAARSGYPSSRNHDGGGHLRLATSNDAHEPGRLVVTNAVARPSRTSRTVAGTGLDPRQQFCVSCRSRHVAGCLRRDVDGSERPDSRSRLQALRDAGRLTTLPLATSTTETFRGILVGHIDVFPSGEMSKNSGSARLEFANDGVRRKVHDPMPSASRSAGEVSIRPVGPRDRGSGKRHQDFLAVSRRRMPRGRLPTAIRSTNLSGLGIDHDHVAPVSSETYNGRPDFDGGVVAAGGLAVDDAGGGAFPLARRVSIVGTERQGRESRRIRIGILGVERRLAWSEGEDIASLPVSFSGVDAGHLHNRRSP